MNKLPAAYLQDELYHFSVDQTMDRLPVDVGDEVTSTQASFLGRAAVLHMLTSHKTVKCITGQHQLQLSNNIKILDSILKTIYSKMNLKFFTSDGLCVCQIRGKYYFPFILAINIKSECLL